MSGYLALDEQEIGCFNPQAQACFVDRIFNCIQERNPGQNGITRDNYEEFTDKIYWPTFYAQFDKNNPLFAVDKKFQPTKKILVVVHNQTYDVKRQFNGYQGFEDLPEVHDDAVNATNLFVSLGVNRNDIRDISDASYTGFNELF